ncbi:phage head-tail joining protein [Pseudomonas sp. ZS1P83]
MSFTQKHLDAVEAAIARGEKTVRYNDRTVEYRTVDELLKAREEIRTSLMSAAGPRSRVVRLYHGGKGV